MKTAAQKILHRPIAEWPLAIVATTCDLYEIECELSALIQRATLLHGYVSHRYNTGCGDQGHEASAKVANRELVRVRKVIGFAYPKNTPMRIQ